MKDEDVTAEASPPSQTIAGPGRTTSVYCQRDERETKTERRRRERERAEEEPGGDNGPVTEIETGRATEQERTEERHTQGRS